MKKLMGERQVMKVILSKLLSPRLQLTYQFLIMAIESFGFHECVPACFALVELAI